jgi:sodium-independent sulfate anion transporter 11
VAVEHKPTLKAIILDFSSVNNVDVTSVQNLIDVRNQLDRYASPDTVDWHIASINNRWTKRALVAAGFGYPGELQSDGGQHRWRSIFSVAEIGGRDSAAEAQEEAANEKAGLRSSASRTDEEHQHGSDSIQPVDKNGESKVGGIESRNKYLRKGATTHGLNRPLFYADLTTALQSAIANVEARGDVAVAKSTGSSQE